MIKKILVSILILLPIYSFANFSKTEKKFNIKVGSEFYAGYTQYEIGGKVILPDGSKGKVHFPISQLKFPLDVLFASFFFDFKPNNENIFSFSLKKNINKSNGFTEDSDWLYSSSIKDVFSESESKINTWILDFNYKHLVYCHSFLKLFFGLGIKFQHFNYEANDVEQWYPSQPSKEHEYVNGLVVTYSVNYYIPYIFINPKLKVTHELNINTKFSFSPYTLAFDEDNHILRDKKSIGESSGYSFLARVELSYYASLDFFVSLFISYQFTQTTGEEVQTRYKDNSEGPAGEIARIENKLNSKQIVIGFNAGIEF